MFLDFLLLLRSGGIKVSMDDWLSLMEGMRLGLHGQTLRGFFILARTLLVKKESDYDKFEELFYQFFKDVSSDELRREMEELLHHPEAVSEYFSGYMEVRGLDDSEIRKALSVRLAADSEDASGQVSAGSDSPGMSGRDLSVGTMGSSAGVQGSGGKSIIHARGSRRFRDWRTDSALESRQFQMAFRLLREMSRKMDTSEEELDIYGTVQNTCRRGGILDITMQPPRKNRLKLMVLMDSGGSMKPYEQLLSLLFQSLHKANSFKDLKIYYFHNCLESVVYTDPSIDPEKTVKTDWILKNISGEYRVIFVGDADMALYELTGGSGRGHVGGLTWFRRFRDQYSRSVWLHPQERDADIRWMGESFIEIEKVFPMFRLSIDGLKDAMYELLRGSGSKRCPLD
ncbi:MAG: VWA containing CoxE family protein [Eubacteriales bacterium]|nr:VWA containing CoxE family protein [Eubacteriales bacterium]